ncbi:hypothetical protein [Legionella shakespearei]|nr:hypothetical protein [Legionella shakespearei]
MVSETDETEYTVKTLFETICELAKAKNGQALMALVQQGFSLSFFQSECNPVAFLAKQDDSVSVEFLVSHFKANRNHAVLGYAIGKHEHRVKQQIALGASKIHALQGYAIGGHEVEVNRLIAEGTDYRNALLGYAIGKHEPLLRQLITTPDDHNTRIFGYAKGGHFDAVSSMMTENNRELAISGFATGGHINQVRHLLRIGIDEQHAVRGYAIGGHKHFLNDVPVQYKINIVQGFAVGGHADLLDEVIGRVEDSERAAEYCAQFGHISMVNGLAKDTIAISCAYHGYESVNYHNDILHLLSFTDNPKLRGMIFEGYKRSHPDTDDILLRKATKLSNFMRQQSVDFELAPQLLAITPSMKIWLLQGTQLVQSKKLPSELFFLITAFMLGLSTSQTEKIIETTHERLFSSCAEKIAGHLKLGLFSMKQYVERHTDALEHYKQRLI